MKPYAAKAMCKASAAARSSSGTPSQKSASATAVASTTSRLANAAQPCHTTPGMPRAPRRLPASRAAKASSASSTAVAPAAISAVRPRPMPSATAATPGVYSHQIATGQRVDGTGWRVATGSNCRLAPMAVITSTPSVTRCSAASGQPSPPTKPGTPSAPASSAIQANRWKATAAPK